MQSLKGDKWCAPTSLLFNVNVFSWVILFVATFTQLSISYVSMGIGTLTPFLADSFHLNNTLIGLVGVSVYVGVTLTSAIAGILVDLVGEKVVLVTGGLLVGVGIMLASRASNFFMLLGLLFFTGIWAAAATPAGSKLVMTWFPYSKRGLALGIRQTGIPLGGMAAALTLPLIAMRYTWHGAMLGMGFVSLFGSVVAFFVLKDSPAQTEIKQDEKHKKKMVRKVLHNRSVWLLSIMSIAYCSAQFTLIAHLLVYVNKALGRTLMLASLFLAFAQLAGAIGRIAFGVFSDTFFKGRRKPPLIVCGILMALMAAAMALVGPTTPSIIIGLLILLFGFVAIGWNGLYVAFMSEVVGVEQSGTGLGIGLTLNQIGVIGFPPLFGFVVDATGSYGAGWLMLSLVVVIGVLAFTMVEEKNQPPQGNRV